MAHKMWGKLPEKTKTQVLDVGDIVEDFWEDKVPNQIRGIPQVAEWADKAVDWWESIVGKEEEKEAGYTGLHDSWCAPVLKQYFPSQAKASTSLGTTGSYRATGREQGAGEHESWVDPVTGEANPSESGSGELGMVDLGNWQATARLQGAIESESSSGTARQQGAGEVSDPLVGATSAATQVATQGNLGVADLGASQLDPITGKSDLTEVKPGGPVGGTNESYTGSVDWNPSGVKSEFRGDVDAHVGAWNFKVEIDGIPASNSSLLTVSGITTETEEIEFKFSTDPFVRSIPGRTKFGDVEITRIYKGGSDEFYKWRQKIERGIDDMRNLTIHLHGVDMDGGPVLSMTLHECYPVKWECPELNAGGSDGAIEKISLSVTRVTSAVGGGGGKKARRARKRISKFFRPRRRR